MPMVLGPASLSMWAPRSISNHLPVPVSLAISTSAMMRISPRGVPILAVMMSPPLDASSMPSHAKSSTFQAIEI